MKILVLNGGSSSFKCWLGELPAEEPAPLWHADVELDDRPIDKLIEPLLNKLPFTPEAVGHRIVHGGPDYRETTLITPRVRAAIEEHAEFAPSHNRFELAAIDAVGRVLGTEVPQFAVFDSNFHRTLEPAAYVYPGPYEWLDLGIRRYGFHGISYQYASRRASKLLGADARRLIVCHLGNGASVAAIRNGKSEDTTMGFTPLEGLMMGTRCGSIDPGILVYLLRHGNYTAGQLDRILNRESGLLGVSGKSGDMREILSAMAAGDARAELAFDVFVHSLVRAVGAMAAVLGGCDALVFTGGIGEHCAEVRDAVLMQIGFLKPKVLVIHAEEEFEIAGECYRLAADFSKGTGL